MKVLLEPREHLVVSGLILDWSSSHHCPFHRVNQGAESGPRFTGGITAIERTPHYGYDRDQNQGGGLGYPLPR